MEEKRYPVFHEGDRVVGIEAFDGNDDIIGVTGTIRSVRSDDVYSVEYDDEIYGGHDCGVGIPSGYGWQTHAKALAPYQDVPVSSADLMSYDEVMM